VLSIHPSIYHHIYHRTLSSTSPLRTLKTPLFLFIPSSPICFLFVFCFGFSSMDVLSLTLHRAAATSTRPAFSLTSSLRRDSTKKPVESTFLVVLLFYLKFLSVAISSASSHVVATCIFFSFFCRKAQALCTFINRNRIFLSLSFFSILFVLYATFASTGTRKCHFFLPSFDAQPTSCPFAHHIIACPFCCFLACIQLNVSTPHLIF